MQRVFNFNPGPSVLPVPVLERARDEMLDWQGQGMSVMEVSHRGAPFRALAEDTEQRLRRLLSIPSNYKVLFLQGGAQMQFAAVPLNLLGDKRGADYVDTGSWSAKAIAEAQRICDVAVVASSRDEQYSHVPQPSEWRLNADAAYLHYCPNETIGGLAFPFVPDTGDVPIVIDCSSNILSEPLNVESFGLIYAGAQKNAGIAGLTLVIVREDLLGRARPELPAVLNYEKQSASESMLNTPATFAWYMCNLVLTWIEAEGGLDALGQRNERKAKMLYDCIDQSNFYSNPVFPDFRSRMNVPFTLADDTLDSEFLDAAKARGLIGLKGHRSVGGMRASLYNALPEQAVSELIDFMHAFERERG